MPTRRGVIGGIGGLLTYMVGGCTGEDMDDSVTMPHKNGDTIDIVDDMGADPTGEIPINGVLDDALDYDDVVVSFPAGDYWIDGDGVSRTDITNVSLIGEENVRLRPSADSNPMLLVLEGKNISIENMVIDQTAPDTSTGISVRASEGLLIRDVTFRGPGDGPGGPTDEYGDGGERHGPFNLIPSVTDPEGKGLIENVHMPDGTVPYYRKGAVWVANGHAGELVFRGCSFEGFSDNAIYASGAGHPDRGKNGAVGVENCVFKNNNVTAIRLGTPGSWAKGCTVVIEEDAIPELPWGAVTGRAGWVWYDFDGTYEDIDVISSHSRGVGIYTHESHTGPLTVTGSRFAMDAGQADAIRAEGSGGRISVMDSSVTGEAPGGPAMSFIDCEIDIDNVVIQTGGANRDGIHLSDARGQIADTVVDVDGLPFVIMPETDIDATNIHDEGDGPRPNPDHDFSRIEPRPIPDRPDDSGRNEHMSA